MTKKESAYSRAGVNIDVKMRALRNAKKKIQKTFTAGAVGEIGSFGGLFKSPGSDMLLVSSTDGVGTKLKVANMAGRHDTVGQDIVNHCVNDILVQGAEPMFFLDYIGASKLTPGMIAQLIDGMCKACMQNGCALIGGETAEMPGLYPEGEYDLVGTMVGSVHRDKVITGKNIRPGDVLIGLPSSGLHTNGYSLARQVIFGVAGLDVSERFPGLRKSVADVLLAVHRSYLKPVKALMNCVTVQGLAHITGGGFVDNVPRILPDGVCAVIDLSTWKVPQLFRFIEEEGRVDHEEMCRVFNMGIGMIVFVREQNAVEAMEILKGAGEKPVVIGVVEKGKTPVKLVD
jgi:phosphoribosylformylglycinamidine cyclo-ligase